MRQADDRPSDDPGEHAPDDVIAVLRGCRRPARYTAFLDADDPRGAPAAPSAPATADEGADPPSRSLGGVAAQLARVLTTRDEAADDDATGGAAEPQPADAEPEDAEPEDAEPADAEPDDVASGVSDPTGSRARQPLLQAPCSIERPGTPPSPGPDPQLEARYLAHSADLTLSGGLGTALAAPLAVCALAEHYVLRRIGGASAAAVTAAAAAAAELGRTAVPPAPDGAEATGTATGTAVSPGFAGLADIIAWLGGEGSPGGEGSAEQWRLARLFQPADDARDLHRLATAAFRPRARHLPRRWVRVAAAALAGLDRASWAVVGVLWTGAVVGGGGILMALIRSPGVGGAIIPFAAVPLAITFALAAAFGTVLLGVHAVRAAAREALGADGWGLVSGADPAQPLRAASSPRRLERIAGVLPPDGVQPLLAWVADRIDDLAGVPTGGHAQRYGLTFGDLWLGRLGRRTRDDLRTLRRAAVEPSQRVVDLTLLTTDLSAGRPHLLPFGTATRPEELRSAGYLFCRACLVGVLPTRVADQMVLLSPGRPDGAPQCPRHAGEPLHDLPEPWDLPVAFAVRLAIATPGLLRTVPLHRARPGTAAVRTHWFCDGAAAGGVPAHVFDVALPRWPTFSIRTQAGPDAEPVLVPEQDAADHPAPWRPVTGGAGLAGALLGAIQGWRDALRVEAPGLRGRLALVRGADATDGCAGADGGIGPFLSRTAILGLAVRGHQAGAILRERFTGPDGASEAHTGTDRYRWVRMRTALTQFRQVSLSIGARIPLYTDLALQYRVPGAVTSWFSPPLAPGSADPAWGDAVAAVTHLRSLSSGGVLDWDTDWGAPPCDPHLRLG